MLRATVSAAPFVASSTAPLTLDATLEVVDWTSSPESSPQAVASPSAAAPISTQHTSERRPPAARPRVGVWIGEVVGTVMLPSCGGRRRGADVSARAPPPRGCPLEPCRNVRLPAGQLLPVEQPAPPGRDRGASPRHRHAESRKRLRQADGVVARTARKWW